MIIHLMRRLFSALGITFLLFSALTFVGVGEAPVPLTEAQSSVRIQRSSTIRSYTERRVVSRQIVTQRRTVSTFRQSGSFRMTSGGSSVYTPFPSTTTQSGVSPRNIYGTVYDAGTEEPLSDAYVALVDGSNSFVSLPSMNGAPQANPVHTDAYGNYSLFVYPGTYKFQVSRTDYSFPTENGVTSTLYVDASQNQTGSKGNLFYLSSSGLRVDLPLVRAESSEEGASTLFVQPDGTLSASCEVPPTVGSPSPLPDSEIGDPTPLISVDVARGDPRISGVNPSCIKMFVNGEEVDYTLRGTKEQYTVQYAPTDELSGKVDVRVEACDTNIVPNVASKEFSFFVKPRVSSLYAAADGPQVLNKRISGIALLPATGVGLSLTFLGVLILGALITLLHLDGKRRRKGASSQQ